MKVSEENTSSIVIGLGKSQISINVKQSKSDLSNTLTFPSVLVEINGLAIEIRESGKRSSSRSRSVSRRLNNRESKLKRSSSYWDYSNLYGPNMWSKIFPQLQCKKFQSPIRIYTDQCEYESILVRYPFVIDTDDSCCQILENTGHSFQVSGKGYSYITGGPVLDEYQFLQFHMHWGSNETEGSEHVIDGIRSPAELHIVTWNTSRYKTPEQAIGSERFGALMVFAILIDIITTDNQNFSRLFDLFAKIIHKGDKIHLDFDIISLKTIMPKNIEDYFTYDGSLTTPMCNESVRWIIFREKIGLSERQFKQLRQLKQTCKTDESINEYIERNYRPLMPLNGRTVYRSFL